MDFTSAKTKEEILSALDDPSTGGLAFYGWDSYGTPKLTVDGAQQSIRSLMAHKAYDPEIEQKMLFQIQKFDPELAKKIFNSGFNPPPALKFTPQATEQLWHFGMPMNPPQQNLLNIKKESLGSKLFGGLLGIGKE